MPGIHAGTLGVAASLATVALCAAASQLICVLRRYDFHSRSQRRLGCVDGLRGYLALGVFLHHYVITYDYHQTGEWANPASTFFVNCGEATVAMFFMITGFLFLNRVLVDQDINWTGLYVSRVFRLVPLYWICVGVVVTVAFWKGGFTLIEAPVQIARELAKWLTFLRSPAINGFGESAIVMSAVMWTLRYEWAFYLALPGVAWIISRHTLLAVGLGLVTVYFFVRPTFIGWIALDSRYFILFMVGGLTAYVYQFPGLRTLFRHWAFSIAGVAALIVTFFAFTTVLAWAPLALLAAFFLPVAMGNSMFGLLELNCSVLLGEVSYSVYLVHGIVLYLVFSMAFPHYLQLLPHDWHVWPAMAPLGVAVVIISWVTHVTVERPAIDLGRRISGRLARRAKLA